MNELSLHILDIVQNSLKANAKLIEITINENSKDDSYTIIISDNGHGMDEKTLTQVSDPFYTTRTTRKVGMGTSLFKMAAELCDGTFHIQSTVGVGTKVTASFVKSHVNRAPLGAIEDTITILNKFIDNMKLDVDNETLKTYMKKIYVEAINIQKSE